MKRFMLVLAALFVGSGLASAKITLPGLLGSDMVLQRESRVKIWGRTDTGRAVTVRTSWDNAKYKVTPDSDGNWCAVVNTGKAGGPYTVTISDGEKLTLGNVLLGEVWICSGQSNMEMPVGGWEHQRVNDASSVIAAAGSTPLIRLYTVPRNAADQAQEDCGGGWTTCSPGSVRGFSATAYFFGKELSAAMPGVPVGLICTCWGGTQIEAWLSRDALEAIPGINLEVAERVGWDNVRAGQLYNGMIYPLRNYAARGFIWYQGEANTINPADYPAITAAKVRQWRELWGNPGMPYYLVQIAPYSYDNPDGYEAPLMMESQYRIPSLVPLSGVAATTDIGHRDCIHPPYKREVGQRLAWLALAGTYGFEGLPVTPQYAGMKVEGDRVRLSFNGVDGYGNCWKIFGPQESLVLGGFEIAGADRVFHKASAWIDWDSNDIFVLSSEVPEPLAVRYAWHNWPEGANVVTDSGLPLPPFRTDDWPLDN